MKRSYISRILAGCAILVAAAFLFFGAQRSFKVFDPETEEFGVESFDEISEKALVIDGTFSGTVRKGEKLYTTYDRSQPIGKQACPT